MRINKYLALNLNISRREADKLIKNNQIKINGVNTKLGQIVQRYDVVTYKNHKINFVDVCHISTRNSALYGLATDVLARGGRLHYGRRCRSGRLSNIVPLVILCIGEE